MELGFMFDPPKVYVLYHKGELVGYMRNSGLTQVDDIGAYEVYQTAAEAEQAILHGQLPSCRIVRFNVHDVHKRKQPCTTI